VSAYLSNFNFAYTVESNFFVRIRPQFFLCCFSAIHNVGTNCSLTVYMFLCFSKCTDMYSLIFFVIIGSSSSLYNFCLYKCVSIRACGVKCLSIKIFSRNLSYYNKKLLEFDKYIMKYRVSHSLPNPAFL
jgi:hypothetical protein